MRLTNMSRPKHCRKIGFPPLMCGFKPFGLSLPEIGKIVLHYDEYESVRLLDYEGLLQETAAEKMNISRPTLSRIYENARKTIAKAFIEGKMIEIEGGNVDFGRIWYRCRKCCRLVDGVENHVPCKDCDNHWENELIPINRHDGINKTLK